MKIKKVTVHYADGSISDIDGKDLDDYLSVKLESVAKPKYQDTIRTTYFEALYDITAVPEMSEDELVRYQRHLTNTANNINNYNKLLSAIRNKTPLQLHIPSGNTIAVFDFKNTCTVKLPLNPGVQLDNGKQLFAYAHVNIPRVV